MPTKAKLRNGKAPNMGKMNSGTNRVGFRASALGDKKINGNPLSSRTTPSGKSKDTNPYVVSLPANELKGELGADHYYRLTDYVTPEEAMNLRNQVDMLLENANFKQAAQVIQQFERKIKEQRPLSDYPFQDRLDWPIASSQLELRTVNMLEEASILTFRDLLETHIKDLLVLPSLGAQVAKQIFNEVKRVLPELSASVDHTLAQITYKPSGEFIVTDPKGDICGASLGRRVQKKVSTGKIVSSGKTTGKSLDTDWG